MRWAYFVLFCFLGAGAASALDNSSPETFLREVYERYRGAGAGLDITGAEAKRVIDPSLFKLIQKSRSSVLGETGILDYDPICSCQDYDISDPVIAVKAGVEGRATAEISFKNFGRPFTVTFDLRRGSEGWLITDVRSASHPSLRAALSDQQLPPGQSSAAALKLIGVPTIAKGTRYRLARLKFLAAGWKPYKSPDAERCPPGDSRCRGFPEVEACAGTGEANCIFLWRRSGRIIEVSTVDEPSVLVAVSCRRGCPASP